MNAATEEQNTELHLYLVYVGRSCLPWLLSSSREAKTIIFSVWQETKIDSHQIRAGVTGDHSYFSWMLLFGKSYKNTGKTMGRGVIKYSKQIWLICRLMGETHMLQKPLQRVSLPWSHYLLFPFHFCLEMFLKVEYDNEVNVSMKLILHILKQWSVIIYIK